MPKKTSFLQFVIVLALLAPRAAAVPYQKPGLEKFFYAKGVIVKFKNGILKNLTSQFVSGKASAFSAKTGKNLSYFREAGGNARIFRVPKPARLEELSSLLEEIRKDPDVEYAEPDGILYPAATPNDSLFSQQWDFQNFPAELAGINMPKAWDISTGADSVVVSVIDTGILTHRDLSPSRILSGYDMISDVTSANDGNGRDSDPSDPGDWTDAGECYSGSPAEDSSWHGTHVSGTIGAASNNSQDVAGINWTSKILPVRVLGKCGGSYSDIADGILWAAGLSVPGVPVNPNPAKVLNLSLGGLGSCSQTLQNAINAAVGAGAAVVVAAGNETDDASYYTPANCDNVITVAALDRTSNLADYSNYGSVVDISAPGGGDGSNGILSTLNDGPTTPGADITAFYKGTSMAAPHVSGVISLMLSTQPLLSPGDMAYNIIKTTRAFPAISNCYNKTICGAGILDAYAALLNVRLSSTSIFPNAGLNSETVEITDLAGTGFLSGASVKLSRIGYSDVPASDVSVVNLNKITCKFPLNGVFSGVWNITVKNPDNKSVTLPGSFLVTNTTPFIGSLSQNAGFNNGSYNITVYGGGFRKGALLKLKRTGYSDINGTGVNLLSANQLSCTLPLTGAAVGEWNLQVSSDPETAVYPESFKILAPFQEEVRVYQGVFEPAAGQKAFISTKILSTGKTEIKVYDQLGRFVKTIFDGTRSPGTYSDAWDGLNEDNKKVASGIYLIRIKTGSSESIKRVAVIK